MTPLADRIIATLETGRRPLRAIRAEVGAPSEAFEAAVRGLLRARKAILFSRHLELPGVKLPGSSDYVDRLETRHCGHCGKTKPVSEFYVPGSDKRGRCRVDRMAKTCADCRDHAARKMAERRAEAAKLLRKCPGCDLDRPPAMFRPHADGSRSILCRVCDGLDPPRKARGTKRRASE